MFSGEREVLKSKKSFGEFFKECKPFWCELFLEQSFETDVHTLAYVHWGFLWKFSVKMSLKQCYCECHWFQSVLYSSFMSLIFCNLGIIILNIFPRIAGHLFCQVLSCTHGMPSSHRLLNSNEENDKFWVSRECIPDGSSWHSITFREGKCQILP